METFLDDYIKVFKKNKEGLQAKTKLAGRIVAGLVVAITLMYNRHVIRLSESEAQKPPGMKSLNSECSRARYWISIFVHARALSTNVPFFKGNVFDYSKLF